MRTVAEWLRGLGAHHDVCAWAEAYGDDWPGAWRACPRGDWLLAIAARLDAPRDALLRAASAAAQTAAPHVDASHEAAIADLVGACLAWAERGGPTGVLEARADALEALEGEATRPAAAAALRAHVHAARTPVDREHAAMAAHAALEAVVFETTSTALSTAVVAAHQTLATAVRMHLPVDMLAGPRRG